MKRLLLRKRKCPGSLNCPGILKEDSGSGGSDHRSIRTALNLAYEPMTAVIIHFFLLKKTVTGLPAEIGKVRRAVRIGTPNREHRPRLHLCKSLFGTENRHRARKAGKPQRLHALRFVVHVRHQSFPSIQARAASRASGSFLTSEPPAMARSGLPPPLPPRRPATKPASSPAFTRPVRSLVTPAAS